MKHARLFLFLVVYSCASDSTPTEGGPVSDAGTSDGARVDTLEAVDAAPIDLDAATSDRDAIAPGDCAEPLDRYAIGDVNGTLEEGETLTVCGGRFGALGPTVLLHDDFEGGAVGDPIGAETTLAGFWERTNGVYVDDASRSGAQAMLLADADETGGSGVNAVVARLDPAGRFGFMEFDEFFVHASIRDLGDFPGNGSSPTTFSSDSSAKDIWVMFGGRGDNYSYSCSQGECNGNDLVLNTHTGRGSFKTDGNETRTSWWLGSSWEFETWNIMSTHLRIDRDRPYEASFGRFEHVSSAGYQRHDYDGQVMRALDGLTPVWDRVKIGAWYRQAGDVRRVLDDIYIAAGPGAAARVELANAATVEEATRLSLCTVESWSDDSLRVSVRLGDMADEAQLFLFVVNADNERSPAYQVR